MFKGNNKNTKTTSLMDFCNIFSDSYWEENGTSAGSG